MGDDEWEVQDREDRRQKILDAEMMEDEDEAEYQKYLWERNYGSDSYKDDTHWRAKNKGKKSEEGSLWGCLFIVLAILIVSYAFGFGSEVLEFIWHCVQFVFALIFWLAVQVLKFIQSLF